jgi:probable rRNA maturation factor
VTAASRQHSGLEISAHHRADVRKQPILTVRNLQRKRRINLEALQTFGALALQRCAQICRRRKTVLSELRQIDVLLISDRRMAALHRHFLNLKGPTDVITFQHGEIFVSVETAHRNAAHYHTSLEAEVRLYITHGILHLLGYDDSTPAVGRTMTQLQKRVLASVAADLRRKSPDRAPV